MPPHRALFIEKLRELEGQYPNTAKPWVGKKPLAWNINFLDVGYLIIQDVRAQARLHYWAAISLGVVTMDALLAKAVSHGVPFSIGVKVEDFG